MSPRQSRTPEERRLARLFPSRRVRIRRVFIADCDGEDCGAVEPQSGGFETYEEARAARDRHVFLHRRYLEHPEEFGPDPFG